MDHAGPPAREPVSRRDGGAVRLRARQRRRHHARAGVSALQRRPRIASLLLSSIAYSNTSPRRRSSIRATWRSSTARPRSKARCSKPQPLLERSLSRAARGEQFQAIYVGSHLRGQQHAPAAAADRRVRGDAVRRRIRDRRLRRTLMLGRTSLDALRSAALDRRWRSRSAVVAPLVARCCWRSGRCVRCTCCKSGLSRLGRGEFDVKLDLPPGDEFGELGDSFNLLSAELSAVRSQLAAGRWRRSSRWSIGSRTRSRCSIRKGSCCSRTPRCGRAARSSLARLVARGVAAGPSVSRDWSSRRCVDAAVAGAGVAGGAGAGARAASSSC